MVKFRVWDRIDKAIKRVYKLDFAEWFVGTDYEGSGERNSFNNEETDRHILMQYTGLKDKNATEIYEGDVCKVIYTDGWELGTVEYEKGTYYIIDNSLGMNYDRIEVIGNIYENKELLDEGN